MAFFILSLYLIASNTKKIGGTKFGITIARPKCLLVSGTTAFKISLSLK
jgi:hypothetical protein